MDDRSAIEIRTGLPETFRLQAAEVLFDAFRSKMQPIFGTPPLAIEVIAHCLNPEAILVALWDDCLVGIAGLQYEGKIFFVSQVSDFTGAYGKLSGLVRLLLLRFLDSPAQDGEVYLESMAVAPHARGRGIGTMLLQAVSDFAVANGLYTVRLDVVNTNPDAFRLYRRVGFVPVHTQRYPIMGRIFGFNSSTIMVKKLG
jgi:ribosomal protein S18 acetylase RimI-like enzyme